MQELGVSRLVSVRWDGENATETAAATDRSERPELAEATAE